MQASYNYQFLYKAFQLKQNLWVVYNIRISKRKILEKNFEEISGGNIDDKNSALDMILTNRKISVVITDLEVLVILPCDFTFDKSVRPIHFCLFIKAVYFLFFLQENDTAEWHYFPIIL